MFSKCGSVVLLLIFIGKDFFVEIIEKNKKEMWSWWYEHDEGQ